MGSEQTATSAETTTNGIAPANVATSTTSNTPFDQGELKAKLDRAWEKIENGDLKVDEGRKLRAEGNKLRAEGTLELANILLDLRERFPADQDFSKKLAECGYGENRIRRQDRAALINMAGHQDLARKVLEHTHRRSYRLIWADEVQPEVQRRLHSAGQPAEDESPATAPAEDTGTVETPVVIQPATRRPKTTTRQTRARKPKWAIDPQAWAADRIFFLNNANENFCDMLDEILEEATPEELAKLHWEPEPLLETLRKLEAKIAALSDRLRK
jgi:hypothetical protein